MHVLTVVWLAGDRIKLNGLLFFAGHGLLFELHAPLLKLGHVANVPQSLLVFSFASLQFLHQIHQILHRSALHLRVRTQAFVPRPKLFRLHLPLLLLRATLHMRYLAHIIIGKCTFQIWVILIVYLSTSHIFIS